MEDGIAYALEGPPAYPTHREAAMRRCAALAERQPPDAAALDK
jgi:hypothetical protein